MERILFKRPLLVGVLFWGGLASSAFSTGPLVKSLSSMEEEFLPGKRPDRSEVLAAEDSGLNFYMELPEARAPDPKENTLCRFKRLFFERTDLLFDVANVAIYIDGGFSAALDSPESVYTVVGRTIANRAYSHFLEIALGRLVEKCNCAPGRQGVSGSTSPNNDSRKEISFGEDGPYRVRKSWELMMLKFLVGNCMKTFFTSSQAQIGASYFLLNSGFWGSRLTEKYSKIKKATLSLTNATRSDQWHFFVSKAWPLMAETILVPADLIAGFALIFLPVSSTLSYILSATIFAHSLGASLPRLQSFCAFYGLKPRAHLEPVNSVTGTTDAPAKSA